MKQLSKTTNQWALCIRLLIENKETGVTMVTAMKDYFHKFNTRLGEVEKGREDKLKLIRLPITKKNRFGHITTFTNYKSLASVHYLIGLHNKLCKLGGKGNIC